MTQRVVDNFTAQGAIFTALDVSNAVKTTLPDVRHREVSPLVRELFERHAMGDYQHSLIDVLADGKTPTQAYLYHLPEHSPDLYDDSMRNQLAIPPVSTSTAKSDDASMTAHSVEAPVPVGRDGRARVSRQILMNAGIVGDEVSVRVNAEAGEILLYGADEGEEDGEGERGGGVRAPVAPPRAAGLRVGGVRRGDEARGAGRGGLREDREAVRER